MLTTAALICLTCALLLALALIVHTVTSAKADLPLNAQWIEELSVERYKPMMRLLDERDLAFLRSQPGFTPRVAANLRAQRCQIFSSYLTSLESDFRRVCTALKILMLQSQYDRPDLASALLRRQMMFAAGMAMVKLRLALYTRGLGGVDVSLLFRCFDDMRVELKSLMPVPAAAA